jgi:hypothetical protein
MQTVYGRHRSGIVIQPPPLPGTNEGTAPARDDVARSKAVALKPNANTASQLGGSLVEALTNSTVYREYMHAFTQTTGLLVASRPVESWQQPLRGKRHESPSANVGFALTVPPITLKLVSRKAVTG